MTVLRTSLFFLHLIFYFPYLRGQQFVHFLLKSLSFLTCFFFFNVVNMLLPLKNIFTYLPPTAFSYFIMLSLFFGQFVSFTFASGWLKDTDHELIRRVSRRFEDVTGLTMDTAEELQV